MEIECIFVAGNWKYQLDGHWDFDIDKRRMCRVIHFVDGDAFDCLSAVVEGAFGETDNPTTLSLSYLSPDLESLDIGKRTPPVILTTDASLRTCCRHLLDKKMANMYVTFFESDEEAIFVTPCLGQKRKVQNSVGGCSFDAGLPDNNSTLGSQEPLEACLVDKGFLQELHGIEDGMRSSLKKPRLERGVASVVEEDNDSDSSGESGDVEEFDVRSMGYDKDFWEPLLDDDYGGSNAVDIMLEHDVCLGGRNLTKEFSELQAVPGGEELGTPSTNHVTRLLSGGSIGGCLTGGQTSRGVVRDHCDVADTNNRNNDQPTGVEGSNSDEIDIAPMFDDTQFQAAFIPDLDIDDGDEAIKIGKTFVSKTECQIALAIYAIRNMFYFKQRRTTKKHFIVSCADLKCGWFVNARKRKENGYYKIRKASFDHTCSIDTRSKFTKMATSKVIAHVFKSKYGVVETGPKPKNLQQLVLEELSVSTSYSKCWRANKVANEEVRGTEEESYSKVEEYLHMLKLANPGSITDLKTETDAEGCERFLYLFLAFGASIEGFKMLRPVLVLDGTHLSGKYKGVLLIASGQDADFQIFPLAFAVVDSETDASWQWFLTKIKDTIGDNTSLVIISDRHQSILKNKGLARNVVSHFKNKGLANLVMKAACSYTVKSFKVVFEEIISSSLPCAKYLKDIGFEEWARPYFKVNRFNLMTSNLAESLNNALRDARRTTIIELLTFIQSMLMRWFSARRDRALASKADTTPEVDKIITRNLKLARGSKVTSVSSWSSEVVGMFGHREYVQLSEKKCTCRSYDVFKIPCGHALIAAGNKRLAFGTLVEDVYSTAVWARTYAGLIKPNGDPGNIDIPLEIRSRVVQPPRTKRPCGRPRLNRIPSTGEILGGKNQRKCGRCGGIGHNKTSCKNPI